MSAAGGKEVQASNPEGVTGKRARGKNFGGLRETMGNSSLKGGGTLRRVRSSD